MKLKSILAGLLIFLFCPIFSQVFPDKDYPVLFNDIQLGNYFPDSKTFPDCIPLMDSKKIDSCYLAEKNVAGFNLNDFINTYFVIPEFQSNSYFSDTSLSIARQIETQWNVLAPEHEKAKGTLLYLPYSCVLPGEMGNEIYYWNSYFIMLGLKEAGKTELIENMIDNYAYLIDTYGFIPAGNRSYYLSRSQPPFFSLMIDLMADIKGNDIYKKFLPQLEKEYNFWMSGKELLSTDNNAIRRAVLLPDGEILNRYWDDDASPRPEAFVEDLKLAELSPEPDSVDFRNIRAACESGWDFSSRWLNDALYMETIETTKILPVDLNCLLYHLELTIAKAYKLSGNKKAAKQYSTFAENRKIAIQKYFWRKKEGFFVDYHFVLEWQNMPNQLAGAYPLFFKIASRKQAKECAGFIELHFLKEGGLQTTTKTTGLLWDAPNGFASIQYISIVGLKNYKKDKLAGIIRQRWLDLNTSVYNKTGRFYEKYNVTGSSLPESDGEYFPREEYGWTMGVYLYLLNH